MIIPCYNYGRYLRQCVKSALMTHLDVRVIIVNDASTDDTREVCDQLCREDRRVSAVHHQVNRGHIATYNHGLELADAELIHLISADDELAPTALDRVHAVMKRHPSVSLAYGRVGLFSDTQKSRWKETERVRYDVVKGTDWISARCRDGRNPICSPEATLRGSVARKIGPYNPEFPRLGDLDMWLRASAYGDVAVLDTQQAFYRKHAANMHIGQFRESLLQGIREHQCVFELLFQTYGFRIEGAERMLKISRARLAYEALSQCCDAFDNGILDTEELAEATRFAQDADASIGSTSAWHSAQKRLKGNFKKSIAAKFLHRLRRSAEWRWENSDLGYRGLKRVWSGKV